FELFSRGRIKDAPTPGVAIGRISSMKQSIALPIGPPHGFVIDMNPLSESLQVAHGEVEVLSFSFETIHIPASAHQSGKAKAANVHAYIDYEVIGCERLRQTIFVAFNDTHEYRSIPGPAPKYQARGKDLIHYRRIRLLAHGFNAQ